MPINDYKEITIPEGSVKQIQDSNGNIIWGSQTAFPYRRLEYIHFNGTDNYIDTNFIITKNTSLGIKGQYENKSGSNLNGRILGSYSGSVTNTSRRFYFDDADQNNFRWVAGSTWNIGNTYDLNTHWFVCAFASDFKTIAFLQRNADNNVDEYFLRQVNTTAFTGYDAHLAIGTNLNTQGGIDTAVLFKGKVYEFSVKSGSDWASTTYLRHYIPVQRKSDGKCGMYDSINKVFYLIQGTNNSSSAGPVVDEYWDLTA